MSSADNKIPQKNELYKSGQATKSKSANATDQSINTTDLSTNAMSQSKNSTPDVLEAFYSTIEQMDSAKLRNDDSFVDDEVDGNIKAMRSNAEDIALDDEEDMANIAAKDPTMNSSYQLNRLLRPGSSYINLNPFAVLDVKFEDAIEFIKKKYRKLSILVHPDKNLNDKERAEKAFEALNRAYKMLIDEKERRKCLEVIDEAREQVKKRRADEMKRQANRDQYNARNNKPAEIADSTKEDSFDKEVWNTAIKLFADLERVRIREENRKEEERLRSAEEKTIHVELIEARKEYNKNYEESRDGRVSNWQQFKTLSKNKRKATDALNFRPPKTKQEKRTA